MVMIMKLLFEPKFDLYVDIITSEAKKSRDIIQLQWGELASVPPERVKDFFVEAFEKGLTHYSLPHGDLMLREVIRRKLRERNGIVADIDNIIVTAGGTAAISFVFRVVAGDGGFIIVQDPSWFGFSGIARYVGARIVRLREYDYSYEALERAKSEIRRLGGELRIVVMNYPSNPTGYVFDIETMKEVIDFAEDNDILILSDEAYEDYVFEGKHISIASIKGFSHIVSVFTISKTYSFTGLRIGYAVGPKKIIDAMALAQVHTYISPPSINQYVARRLLEENIAKGIVEKNLKLLKQNLAVVKEFVEANEWEIIEPKGGIYAFIRLPGINSAEFSLRLLREEKVAVAPGIDFGENWKEWLRITIAKSKEEIQEGLKRISRFYRRFHH